MRILLDTHAFLWWITDDQRISLQARGLMADRRSDLFVSSASGWEIAVKASLGRIKLPSPIDRFLIEQLRENRMEVLPIQMAHALHVQTLPRCHRDPFDRILVAQAQLEKLTILSGDQEIAQCDVEVLW